MLQKNFIAVTACLKRCSVAIFYENHLYEANEDIDAASNLVCIADNLVKSKNIDLQKIDGVITASGPGSFTGIRVAQSFAKGLALSLKLPSVSVSYFDVIRSIYSSHFSMKQNISKVQEYFIVIKSNQDNVYYQSNGKHGISSYESLYNQIENNSILIGDAIDGITLHYKNKIIETYYVPNFRDAKYLLGFTQYITHESQIHQLYMGCNGKI